MCWWSKGNSSPVCLYVTAILFVEFTLRISMLLASNSDVVLSIVSDVTYMAWSCCEHGLSIVQSIHDYVRLIILHAHDITLDCVPKISSELLRTLLLTLRY